MTDLIESHVSGNFAGWKPNTQFVLVNGQVWEQTSDEYFYYPHHGVKVTITADGSDGVLEVEGIPQTVRVRRIK
jgi:hypothetical protein